MSESVLSTSEPIIEPMPISAPTSAPASAPASKITCECGSSISNTEQAIYIHTHGICHKFRMGLISKDRYEEYRNAQKAKYADPSNAEKTEAHRAKMKTVMREKNGVIFEKSRETVIFCEHCRIDVKKPAIYLHNKSKKHIYALQGMPVPYAPRKKIVS